MKRNTRFVKASVAVILLGILSVAPTPLNPAVADHESDTTKQCAQDNAGTTLFCVESTRDPHPDQPDYWSGWCEVTEAQISGNVTCTDSEGRQATCEWNETQDGCITNAWFYAPSDDYYEVTAEACIPTDIQDTLSYRELTLHVNEPVLGATLCLRVSAPEEFTSSDGGGKLIVT